MKFTHIKTGEAGKLILNDATGVFMSRVCESQIGCRCSLFAARLLQRTLSALVVFLVIALQLHSLQSPAIAADERPNFVFILADDLGWADVGFHQGNTPTPFLDQLATDSLELTQHYVAPVCSPTRAGLLTGRYWSRFSVTTPSNARVLNWDTLTLPRALRSVGYDTCLTGKWHLGSLPEEGPNHFGFDHSYGSLAGGVSPWNHRYNKGPWTVTWHRNEKLLEEDGHVTDLLTREAVKWIDSRGDAPFFLYVPFTAVHLPLKEPQKWLDRVPASITGDVPRHYSACLLHLDDAVRQIVEAIDRKGCRASTLLVVSSDNGGSTVENNDLKYPDDNCPNGRLVGNNKPFRGQKGDPYEGGTRVPTIVSWPGRIDVRKSATPTHITDWMPTFCDLAGVQMSEVQKPDWDGTSLAGHLLRGDELPDRSLYSVAPGGRARTLRHGNWKLISFKEKNGERHELYDIAADPAESKNLASSHPEQLAAALARLAEAAIKDGDAAVPKGQRGN